MKDDDRNIFVSGNIISDKPNANGDIFTIESMKAIAENDDSVELVQHGNTAYLKKKMEVMIDPGFDIPVRHELTILGALNRCLIGSRMYDEDRVKRLRQLVETFEDLKKFSKIRLRKKRSKKKFDKNFNRYLKKDVCMHWLGIVMTAPIRRQLNFESIGRKLLMVDELPQGAYAAYENDPRMTVVGDRDNTGPNNGGDAF